ncbi:uncharacterized protein LOC129592429 isoform X2 [Paramacrobiotus metropolitanus]|nr:uncharacterized protein LOC129592429 isoform X2 [Paramacrobiotus metropolitanus]XP_055344439.1 uncharacterized protein LOC129592429 isoform X2 [Paramacrobiotus metropolitanus]XP_055344441.1 uncharacterized protein LOC129592429 isoform X2 [Paramacrobiotus metropolitanus]
MQESVTRSGDISQLRGTVRYMSPEMLRKFCHFHAEFPGRKTDMWSLGCIILEIAEYYVYKKAGQLYEKDGKILNVRSIATEVYFASLIIYNYVPFISSDIPARLAAYARLCLKQNPKKRISAKGLLQEFAVSSLDIFASNTLIGNIRMLSFDPVTSQMQARELGVPRDLPLRLCDFQLSIPKRELISRTITSDRKNEFFLCDLSRGRWRSMRLNNDIKGAPSRFRIPVVIDDMIYYFRDIDLKHGHELVAKNMRNGSVKLMRKPVVQWFNVSAVAEFGQKILYAHNK